MPHSRLRQISPWDKLATDHIERLFLSHASICHTSIFPTMQFGEITTAEFGAPQDFLASIIGGTVDNQLKVLILEDRLKVDFG